MVHNVNKLTMIFNKGFYFETKNKKKIHFTVPTMYEYTSELDFVTFINILEMDIKENQEYFISNKLEVINLYQGIIAFYDLKVARDIIETYLERYMPGLKIEKKGFYVDEHRLTYEEFDFFVDIILKSVVKRDLEKKPESEEDEFDKKVREANEKVKKLKEKKQEDSGITIENVIIAIIKEFNLSMDEILGLNVFGFMWYYSYIWKVDTHRLNTVLAGGGGLKNASSYKYFTEL